MTHTPRTLSLVAALLLALAACTDDLTQTPATPGGDLAGQPVQFSTTALSVTPAGSPQTRAAETETDFPAEGTTMTVYLLADDGTPIQQADYSYSTDGKTYRKLGSLNARYLSTETVGGFTGIMFGLFATAGSDASKATAEYDYFDYERK